MFINRPIRKPEATCLAGISLPEMLIQLPVFFSSLLIHLLFTPFYDAGICNCLWLQFLNINLSQIMWSCCVYFKPPLVMQISKMSFHASPYLHCHPDPSVFTVPVPMGQFTNLSAYRQMIRSVKLLQFRESP